MFRTAPTAVVAFIAGVGVVAGTAIAAPDATIQAIKKTQVRKIAKKQANKAITKRAPTLSVAFAAAAAPTGAAGGDLTGQYPNPTLGTGKVTSGKLANSAVTAGKLADSAVTSGKLANSAVTSAKIADSAVSGTKLAANAITGPKVAPSAIGARELSAIQEVQNSESIAANGFKGVTVACPAGTTVISGGGNAAALKISLNTSRRLENGWSAIFQSDSLSPSTVTVYAYCLAGN